MDLTFVVGTFGGNAWTQLAKDRAIPSGEAEAPVVYRHRDTLAEARNTGLDVVTTEWVAFLDADDEIQPGYKAAMATGTADVRAPSVEYVAAHRQAPYVPKVAGHTHDCSGECLPAGNWLVIGSAIRTDIAKEIRFREFPVYEDWDFFLRAYLAGATVEAIPAAVYRAHVRTDSRNRAPSMKVKNKVHHDILESIA